MHNTCPCINADNLPFKFLTVGIQLLNEIHGYIIRYYQSDAGIPINLAKDFQILAILFHIICLCGRQPRIHQQIHFSASHGSIDGCRVGILQYHPITLLFQNHFHQMGQGNAIIPVYVSYADCFIILLSAARCEQQKER